MRARGRPMCPAQRQRGYTYLGLMLVIVIIGIASVATLKLGSVLQRQAAEEELLAIGAEFRDALLSYANTTPPGQARSPRVLEDLLKDPRYPRPRRHLRNLYVDPMTGKDTWGTVMAPDGTGIVGIYSLSSAAPLKIGNFDPEFQDFAGKTSYAQWIFAPPAALSGVGAIAAPRAAFAGN